MRKSTLNTHGVAVAGHVKFEIDVIKLYQETGQKYHVFLLKRTTPGNQKLTYAFNKPFLEYRKWYFAGKYFVHLQSAVKMKQ